MEIVETAFDTTRLAVRGYFPTDEERAIIAKIPQTTIVRNHLIRFGEINDRVARDIYGITRLAAVIYLLRYKVDPVMFIESEKVKGKNRFGKKVEYVNYTYKED